MIYVVLEEMNIAVHVNFQRSVYILAIRHTAGGGTAEIRPVGVGYNGVCCA